MDKETYKKILIALANRKEAWQYEIAKEARLTYAPVHQAIERLLLAGLIEEVRTEVGQGPLPKRYFRLTFPGLLTVLNFFQISVHEFGSSQLLEDESGVSNLFVKKTRAALIAQREFYPQVKFFLEWECLEKIFDTQDDAIPGLYDVLGNTVAVCIGKFRPLEKANLIEENLRSNTPSLSEHSPTEPWFELWFDAGLASKKWSSLTPKERLEDFKNNFLPEYRYLLNKQMQQLFVRTFFNGLMTTTTQINDAQIDLASVENKVLFEFAYEYIEKERNRRMASIKRFSEESNYILNLFAKRPNSKQPMGGKEPQFSDQ
jgi:hypothetical protein